MTSRSARKYVRLVHFFCVSQRSSRADDSRSWSLQGADSLIMMRVWQDFPNVVKQRAGQRNPSCGLDEPEAT